MPFSDIRPPVDQPAERSQLIDDAINNAKSLVPIKALQPAYLVDLFRHVEVQAVFDGQSLFDEGTMDGQHIYLLSGEVKLVWERTGRALNQRARDIILPLAHQQPRQCHAITMGDCTVLRIDSDRLDRTMSWSQISDYLLAEVAMNPSEESDLEWVRTILSSNLFVKVPPVNVEKILNRLQPIDVKANEVILEQGALGDCCYFIKEGEAEVWVKEDEKTYKVADIGPGRCFGEDALVNETVRNATVVMKSKGLLVRLAKSDFQLLLREPVVEELTLKETKEIRDNPIFVDIRTDDEYAQGHLQASANIPLSLLSLKKRLLSEVTPYIFYCDTGRRSKAAAYLLGKEGYNVFALQGGLQGEGANVQLVKENCFILRDGELVSGS